jgi:HEAT repeat protein/energy-coupling factor transporter ATP-binding protein EcfA2
MWPPKRYIFVLAMLVTTLISVMIIFRLTLGLGRTNEVHQAMMFVSASLFIPAPDATITTSTQALSANGSGLDPAIIVALIGAAAALAAALIAMGVAFYQIRQNRRIEREKAELQLRHDREIERYRHELDAQFAAKQQEEEIKTATLEVARHDMLRAQTREEQARAYRRALHVDPRISRLQILEMSRPLEVSNVYVRVRVHEETILRYDIDPLLSTAEQQHDPNVVLRANWDYLERRVSSATDPDEAIRKYQHCVILGDPGAGKTTLLKHLALQSAESALKGLPDLPIHIELNAFAADAEHRDLLDFAAATWDERYAFLQADARAYMDEMLKVGKAMLLLDALDETIIGEEAKAAEASYRRSSDAILRVATRYPNAPIVVTARKAGYQQGVPLTGFTELEVVDFRTEDIEQFVTKWFACSDNPQKETIATDLIDRLRRNARIQALAANPLLLSLIVLVYEAQLDLPDRRAELYKRCIDVLLAEWDARRNVRRRREFKPEHKRQLLAELAWHFHLQGLRYFPEREIQAEIARFLPVLGLPAEEYDRVLREIANENGLLKEQARGWFGFLHLTLQEYFVAQYVSERNELGIMLTHIGDPWWEEVILLYAGQVSDASPLLEHLLGGDRQEAMHDDLFHLNLLTAGRCLATYPTIRQVSLREEVISRLSELMATFPYTLTKRRAIEALIEIGSPAVISRLVRLLSDEQVNVQIRWRIAIAFGWLREQSVVSDLLRLLGDAQINIIVRQRIAEALGMLRDLSAVPELLRLLGDAQTAKDVRCEIAEALGTLGDLSVVPELLGLLRDEQVYPQVRRSCVVALEALGDPSVVPELLRMLNEKQVNAYVRQRIAAALGILGRQAVVPNLMRLLDDKQVNVQVRASIAEALGAAGDLSVVPELLRLLNKSQVNVLVRRSIASALGALGDPSAVPDLLRLLNDRQVNVLVRRSIAAALRGFSEQLVVPDLMRLLNDEQVVDDIRWRIAATLGTLKEESVVPHLVRLLGDGRVHRDVNRKIAEILGWLGNRSVVPELLRLLNDPQIHNDIRWSIAHTLGWLANDETTVRALVALLPVSDVADIIYNSLWYVSRRLSARVFVREGEATEKKVEIVRWGINEAH